MRWNVSVGENRAGFAHLGNDRHYEITLRKSSIVRSLTDRLLRKLNR